jgi:hypothetical protein
MTKGASHDLSEDQRASLWRGIIDVSLETRARGDKSKIIEKRKNKNRPKRRRQKLPLFAYILLCHERIYRQVSHSGKVETDSEEEMTHNCRASSLATYSISWKVFI